MLERNSFFFWILASEKSSAPLRPMKILLCPASWTKSCVSAWKSPPRTFPRSVTSTLIPVKVSGAAMHGRGPKYRVAFYQVPENDAEGPIRQRAPHSRPSAHSKQQLEP